MHGSVGRHDFLGPRKRFNCPRFTGISLTSWCGRTRITLCFCILGQHQPTPAPFPHSLSSWTSCFWSQSTQEAGFGPGTNQRAKRVEALLEILALKGPESLTYPTGHQQGLVFPQQLKSMGSLPRDRLDKGWFGGLAFREV